MRKAKSSIEWSPDGWESKSAIQQPIYKDPERVRQVVDQLGQLPPLVTSWEVEALRAHIVAAQEGRAFVLQGGDCAESFAECTSEKIVSKLKILLQMSVVLTAGLKRPIVRVGRMAGQYAKPRSADLESRDGVSLPSYRGDLVNRMAFNAAEREPDPELMLRGYERASLTLNFVRSLIDGGFADLHHPENWDLEFFSHSPLAAEYHANYPDLSGRRLHAHAAMDCLFDYETTLSQQLIEGLEDIPGVTVQGITSADALDRRVPTVSFTHESKKPDDIARELAEQNIFVWSGHNYAVEVARALDIYTTGGAVRVGPVHYNNSNEINELICSLGDILG